MAGGIRLPAALAAKEKMVEMQILKHKTSRFKDNAIFAAEYNLAVEELLEIYIDDSPYAITMRLPGDDINLVTGFCFTEGIIASRDDLLSIRHCETIPGQRRMLVYLDPKRSCNTVNLETRRNYLAKSSCGLCGKSEAGEIYSESPPVKAFHSMSLGDILGFRQSFETRQTIFQLTGSTHSASLYSLRRDLLAFAEDIGRHNAFDKVIGTLVNEDKTREAFLAIVSSRLSFEMVQKAGVLGLEILAGLSAPTSMAVDMADTLNITLIGFLRENSMSIYTHRERIFTSPLDPTEPAALDHARVLLA
ncbi:MAG: formate dehydrogenase accessory sulfurtransferase FdhD [Syntrophobacteraceae bacterium]